jgi:hypothetical protein
MRIGTRRTVAFPDGFDGETPGSHHTTDAAGAMDAARVVV